MSKKNTKKPVRKVPKGGMSATTAETTMVVKTSTASNAKVSEVSNLTVAESQTSAKGPTVKTSAPTLESQSPFDAEHAAIAALVVKPGAQKVVLERKRLPGAFRLLRASLSLLLHNKKVFFGITGVYALLMVLFVQSTSVDVGSTKDSLDQLFSGHGAKLTSAASLFSYMLSSSGAATADGAVYQFFFVLFVSLALILALRHVFAQRSLRVRDAFYNGMYPLAPFVLVLAVVTLQLIPLVIGVTVYSAIVSNNVAISMFEQVLWLLAFMGTILLSMRFVSSSFLALYVVTLPDMAPKRALKTAKQLVRGRRWQVMRKMVFLPLALLAIGAAIMLPVILVAPGLAGIVMFVLLLLGLAAFHSYMFGLYRELMA